MAGDGALARSDGFAVRLASARTGEASVLLLKGAPGSGRTHVLDQLVAASVPDWLAIRITASISERDLRFGGLSALLHRVGVVAPELRPSTAGLLRHLARTSRVPSLALFVELLDLVEELAAVRDVVIAIDDAQHLDDQSAAALRFVAARVSAPGLLLVIAVDRQDDRFDAASVPVMETPGLTAADAARLLRDSLGVEPDPHVVEVLLDHVGDAPGAFTSLVDGLSPEQLAGWHALPVPLPKVPGDDSPELDRLTARGRSALALLALSSVGDTATVGRALEAAGLGWSDLGPAEELDLVRLGGPRVFFPRSQLRSAAAAAVTAADRRNLHAALAHAIGTHAPSLRASAAHHLAAAGPGHAGDLASVWCDVAADASGRGALKDAARATAEAARHRPPGDARGELLLAAARLAVNAGNGNWARRLLDAAEREAQDDALRDELHELSGHLQMVNGAPLSVMHTLVARARVVSPHDPATAARLLTGGAMAALIAGRLEEGRSTAELAVGLASAGAKETALAGTVLGVLEVLVGDGPSGIGRIEEHRRGLGDATDADALLPRTMALGSRIWADDPGAARGGLRDLIAQLESVNLIGSMVVPLSCLAAAEHRLGYWDSSLGHARRARDIGGAADQQPAAAGTAHAVLAAIAAARCDVESAEAHIETLRRLASVSGCDPLLSHAAAARGLLDLGVQNPHRAIASLEEVEVLSRDQGLGDAAVLASAGNLLSAYVAVERRDDARALLDQLDDEVGRTERHWTRAVVHRGHAMLGTDDDPYGHLDAAVELFAAIGNPFEVARTQLTAAARHLEDGHLVEARRAIGTARDLLEPLDAKAWLARCDLLATRAGDAPEPERPRPLSDQERRVADLVVTGLTNRAIAATMVLSEKTIEYHLHNIYRRWGLSSRRELIALLRAAPALEEPGARS